ncbi:hypothetical protein J6590_027072 [Homalodisca vitripennis]|nr:hypothetical protein J6590_027072 [Homalodisca vitripennis]
MTVAGWGTTGNCKYVKPSELSSSTLDLDMDWESQICAAGKKPAQSPCPGDSADPLMYYNTTGVSRK